MFLGKGVCKLVLMFMLRQAWFHFNGHMTSSVVIIKITQTVLTGVLWIKVACATDTM